MLKLNGKIASGFILSDVTLGGENFCYLSNHLYCVHGAPVVDIPLNLML